MSSVWVEIKNGVVTWVSTDAGNVALHNQVPGCHAERYIQHREAAKRIHELKSINTELYDALDCLIAVVGITTFKYKSQRAVLEEVVNAGLAALAKARGEESRDE